ncbi:MAG TPA: carbohydrate kinase [Draconibacterium sp.]|jgi:fructokinase|nr:carbohydrate kinase [Draconibacterium sp.]
MKNKPFVAGIGELLWDVLPTGKQVGGAPCNFAFHALQAGCESIVISAVGNEQSGDELLSALAVLNINCEFIQRNGFSTGTVTVKLNESGHPSYSIHENTAWDNVELNPETESKFKELDAVCYGSLGQRNSVSAETIQRLLESVKPGCLKVFDINLRQHFYSPEIITKSLEFANILKLNDEELPVLSGIFGLTGDVKKQLEQLSNQFKLQYIVYTMGEKGSIIMRDNEFSFLGSPKVVVADTVGAGDSFTAVLVSGLLKGLPLNKVHEAATRTAAFVCTQKGATPVIPFDIF